MTAFKAVKVTNCCSGLESIKCLHGLASFGFRRRTFCFGIETALCLHLRLQFARSLSTLADSAYP